MINFIVCDDEKKYLDFVKETVTKYMMKNEMEYKLHLFDDYNNKFLNTINKKLPFKIYILDIETPTRSGIDVARIIRNKDINSVIIFLTGHQELSQVILRNDFLFLSFINKFDNCEKRLINSIDKAIKVLNVKKTINFKDNGVQYIIALDDILYITKLSVERRCVIKTDYGEFKISKGLNEILTQLNSDFIRTHRAFIVNIKRIAAYSKSKRLVTFDNGEKADVLASNFKGELI